MTPKVSVIIPNYNYARFLRQRIESVLSQTYEDFEVILLDDCSTDNSREIIESYRSHPRVSVVEYNESNSGSPFRQWEKGLEMARGEYAWIAEADDFAHPTFLERSVRAMDAAENVAVVKCMSELIDENGAPAPRKYFESFPPDGSIRIYDGDEYIAANMINWNHFYNASMTLFRVGAWRSLPSKPYLEMRYVGDWLFWSMLMAGNKVGEVRERLSCFRFHGGSVTDRGRKSLEESFERKLLLAYMLRYTTGLGAGDKMYLRYQADKVFHDKKYRGMLAGWMSRNQVCDLASGISRVAYPVYWFYKHVVRRHSRRKQAVPVMEIRD